MLFQIILLLLLLITAVISIALYLTDKDEHAAFYKINNNVYIKTSTTTKLLYDPNIVFLTHTHHARARTHTHTHTHTLCLSLSLTQTHTHTHTHNHTHTYNPKAITWKEL